MVREQTLTVDVPAGVADGMELQSARVEGTRAAGGPPGDLFVSLHVAPHPIFERRGQDLVCELPVPMTQAALGADVEIPTLEGEEKVRLEAGTASGTVIRLRGRGVPNVGRRGRGDLFVTVRSSRRPCPRPRRSGPCWSGWPSSRRGGPEGRRRPDRPAPQARQPVGPPCPPRASSSRRSSRTSVTLGDADSRHALRALRLRPGRRAPTVGRSGNASVTACLRGVEGGRAVVDVDPDRLGGPARAGRRRGPGPADRRPSAVGRPEADRARRGPDRAARLGPGGQMGRGDRTAAGGRTGSDRGPRGGHAVAPAVPARGGGRPSARRHPGPKPSRGRAVGGRGQRPWPRSCRTGPKRSRWSSAPRAGSPRRRSMPSAARTPPSPRSARRSCAPRPPRWPAAVLALARYGAAGLDSHEPMPAGQRVCVLPHRRPRRARRRSSTPPTGSWPSATANPQAPTHILLIPKDHIESVAELTEKRRRRPGRAVHRRRPPGQGRGGRPVGLAPGREHRPGCRPDRLPPAPAPARRAIPELAARLRTARPRP